MTTPQSLQCYVCGDSAEQVNLISECLNCSRSFHLNPYNSGDHKDCGDAVIGPSSGIEFWCNPCLAALEQAERAAAEDPRAILDRLSGADQLQPPPPVAPPPAAPAPSHAPPPARRGRSAAPRRYRRIDGA